jgi:DNA-binding GntR family transcriptional regulator
MADSVDREKSEKLYVQLYQILKSKIDSGEWPVGSQIPIEDELCRTFEVSKATVRLALLDLARQGYLMRQQGKGTFVCKRVISEGLTMLTSFRELMLEAGIPFTTTLLAKTVMMPAEDLDIELDIADNKHIIYIKRLRSVENEPILLQETYIPHHICPNLLNEDIEQDSIFELIDKKYNIKITKVKHFIEITYPTDEEARLLNLPAGSVALLLSQQLYSGETQIMYIRSIKRPDRFRFLIELERKNA